MRIGEALLPVKGKQQPVEVGAVVVAGNQSRMREGWYVAYVAR